MSLETDRTNGKAAILRRRRADAPGNALHCHYLAIKE
jgi:hypothetical protein